MTKGRSGSKSKQKGKRGERHVVKELKKIFPHLDLQRSIQSRGAEKADIVGFPGLWIEVQYANKITPELKLLQAIRDCTEHGFSMGLPIAVCRQTRSKTMSVTLRVSDLLRLLEVQGIRSTASCIHEPTKEEINAYWSLNATPVTLSFQDFFSLPGVKRLTTEVQEVPF